MKVPYLDLPGQFHNKAVLAVIARQLTTCHFVLGPEVETFESEFAALCGTAHAVGVNSGTDAIFLALKAMDIGPGDEVITVPNSFVATTGAVVAAGARPVFVDVGPDYNIDVEKIPAAITDKTRAILPVHLTGNPADMPAIMAIAEHHGLRVVEDAAQAVGATIDGKCVGAFGDAGAFSLHPLKNLNVCGDGGMITTDSDDMARQFRLLRNHGLLGRDHIDAFGYNSRLDTLHAAVGSLVAKRLPEIVQQRRRNAEVYDELLADLPGITIPPRRANVMQVFHTYIVMAERRDELMACLAKSEIDAKIHYPVPIHIQGPCRRMGYAPGDFPEAEKQAAMIVSLPVHQHLSEEQIRFVCGTIRKFYQGCER